MTVERTLSSLARWGRLSVLGVLSIPASADAQVVRLEVVSRELAGDGGRMLVVCE